MRLDVALICNLQLAIALLRMACLLRLLTVGNRGLVGTKIIAMIDVVPEILLLRLIAVVSF